jgi:iron complex outermembrane receptor protein
MLFHRLSRTAVAHAALLALCGAAHAQAQPEGTPEATLAPVTVNAGTEKENPTGPVVGFTARRALSATKTDTPLIETPQAISVVTRDQFEAQGVQTLRQTTAYSAGVVSNSRCRCRWAATGASRSPPT